MIIYTDHNGVTVSAAEGADTEGHIYLIRTGDTTHKIEFQNGGVAEHGVNGLTNEALLATLIHRTKVLDAKCSSAENQIAIDAMLSALTEFEARTARRRARGVEGLPIV